MSIDEEKKSLRASMRALLEAMTPKERDEGSGRACSAILGLEAWAAARTVMLFAPLPLEIDVFALVRLGVQEKKLVCLPRVDWQTRTIEPVQITDPARDLMPDRHGLMNPAPGLKVVAAAEIDLALIPGLAFALSGARLGRGGGFYDRFLSNESLEALTVGVCFERQVVAEGVIPRAEHDEPVAGVVGG